MGRGADPFGDHFLGVSSCARRSSQGPRATTRAKKQFDVTETPGPEAAPDSRTNSARAACVGEKAWRSTANPEVLRADARPSAHDVSAADTPATATMAIRASRATTGRVGVELMGFKLMGPRVPSARSDNRSVPDRRRHRLTASVDLLRPRPNPLGTDTLRSGGTCRRSRQLALGSPVFAYVSSFQEGHLGKT